MVKLQFVKPQKRVIFFPEKWRKHITGKKKVLDFFVRAKNKIKIRLFFLLAELTKNNHV